MEQIAPVKSERPTHIPCWSQYITTSFDNKGLNHSCYAKKTHYLYGEIKPDRHLNTSRLQYEIRVRRESNKMTSN